MKSPYIRLDETRCHQCMKCVRACPTGAMTYIGSRPEADNEDCILCGRCYSTCSRGAQRVVSEFSRVERWLKLEEEVVLSVDPSFAAIWPDLKALRQLLTARGFKWVEETAQGCAEVSSAYAKLIEAGQMPNIITTACPVVNTLIEREFPDLTNLMAPVASPEIVHGRMLRKKYPNAKIVFLTPCIASYREIKDSRFAGLFDVCLSMEELSNWIRKDYEGSEKKAWDEFEGSAARLFATSGGIIRNLESSPNYKFLAVDGIGRIRTLLKSIRRGEINNCFVEVSACRGSCMAGPLNVHFGHNEWLGQQRILEHTRPGVFEPKNITPLTKAQWGPANHETRKFTSKEVDMVMRSMGKTSKEKIFDCGACGYNTCREKAVAVLMGRADPKVCLPEALSQMQSMANMIIANTPNGIVVFDEAFEVEEMNAAARKMLQIEHKNPLGMSVFEVFPEGTVAEAVMEMRSGSQYSRNWYECYQKLFDEVIIHISDRKQSVVILMDRTDEDARILELNNMRERTMKVTQDVINEQMRTVQEIASLLGETTAKSKIALLQLQRVMDEGK